MFPLQDFAKTATEFANFADFVTIYISEAHPIYGWYFTGNKYKLRQHGSINEKVTASKNIFEINDFILPGHKLIDSMDKSAELLYGSLPERLFIIMDGVVVYEGGRGPRGYKIGEIANWLKNNKASS